MRRLLLVRFLEIQMPVEILLNFNFMKSNQLSKTEFPPYFDA